MWDCSSRQKEEETTFSSISTYTSCNFCWNCTYIQKFNIYDLKIFPRADKCREISAREKKLEKQRSPLVLCRSKFDGAEGRIISIYINVLLFQPNRIYYLFDPERRAVEWCQAIEQEKQVIKPSLNKNIPTIRSSSTCKGSERLKLKIVDFDAEIIRINSEALDCTRRMVTELDKINEEGMVALASLENQDGM
uniref:Uncharacterized protein n=1 Tax=Heterorhabditis bacteriophora TaxID=37862 RepID=A0A1I7WJX4_HETBA